MANTEKGTRKSGRAKYLIISLVTAITAWSLVAFTTDTDIYKTVHNVNVELTGVQELRAKGLVASVVNDGADFAVRLGGNRNDIIDAIDRVKITADVSGISSTGEFDVEGTVKTSNQRLQTEKKNFSTVPVIVEEYEEKEISIEVHQIGSFKDKPILSIPEHDQIKIGGAKSEIDNVEKGYITVDLARITESGETVSGIVLTDYDGNVISEAKTITGPVSGMRVRNIVCNTVELPVKAVLSDELAEEHTLTESLTDIQPQSVTVGVAPGYTFSYVTAVIDELTTDEKEYSLVQEEGMCFLPDKNTVKIKAVFDVDEKDIFE